MKGADKIQAAVGIGTLFAGLLRGKPLMEAQADAKAVLLATDPLAQQMSGPLEEFLRRRREKAERAAQQEQRPAPRCKVAGCVLDAGHQIPGGYCQDANGVLFAVEDEK